MISGTVTILLGFVVIIVGFTSKHVRPGFIRQAQPDEKPVPVWLGRAIYSAVGLWCIYIGIVHIRHG